jgi:hypothetical protein
MGLDPQIANRDQPLGFQPLIGHPGLGRQGTKDTEFDSPSAAAAVVHGGGANGLTAWKDANGKSLKELEEG